MNKLVIIIVGIIGAALFFLFNADPYPDEVYFQGVTLSSKQDINNTVDKEYDILSYRDDTNHHVLIFGIRNNSIRTLEEFTQLYLSNFERQGYVFEGDGVRNLGVKKDEVIHITQADAIQGVIIYIKKEDKPVNVSLNDQAAIFDLMEGFSF